MYTCTHVAPRAKKRIYKKLLGSLNEKGTLARINTSGEMHDKLFNQVSKLNIVHVVRAGETYEFHVLILMCYLSIPRNLQINIK